MELAFAANATFHPPPPSYEVWFQFSTNWLLYSCLSVFAWYCWLSCDPDEDGLARPYIHHLFVWLRCLLSAWLHVQSTCLSTLQAQGPRRAGCEWDSSPQQFFVRWVTPWRQAYNTEHLNIAVRKNPHLQAAGSGLGWFQRKIVTLKSLCFRLAWRRQCVPSVAEKEAEQNDYLVSKSSRDVRITNSEQSISFVIWMD